MAEDDDDGWDDSWGDDDDLDELDLNENPPSAAAPLIGKHQPKSVTSMQQIPVVATGTTAAPKAWTTTTATPANKPHTHNSATKPKCT